MSQEPPIEVDPIMLVRRIELLTSQLNEHDNAISGVLGALEDLTQTPKAAKLSLYSWVHADGENRANLWRALSQWVTWHNERYGPTNLGIEACWYRHPAVVDHLTALMEAWRAAYTGHSKASSDAVYYLLHFMAPLIHKIRTEQWGFRNCSANRHALNLSSVDDDSIDTEEFNKHMQSEVTGYRKQDPPIGIAATAQEEPPPAEAPRGLNEPS